MQIQTNPAEVGTATAKPRSARIFDDTELKGLWRLVRRNGRGHVKWNSEAGRAIIRALRQSHRAGVAARELAETLDLSVTSIYVAMQRPSEVEVGLLVNDLNIGSNEERKVSLESIAQDIKRLAKQNPSVEIEFSARLKNANQ